MRQHQPRVVLHAAAHKHVPLMERNVCEAIQNNIFGTRTVGRLAAEYGVEVFVLVSTDKAVHPTSVMGTTKRAAEMIVQALDTQHETRFVAVRFGNVLGSAGSVIPIFREQIREGGPLDCHSPGYASLFHDDPRSRSTGATGWSHGRRGRDLHSGYGAPVKIVDLARDMIRLSGLRPDEDIQIVFTGVRPGEKLVEWRSRATPKCSRRRLTRRSRLVGFPPSLSNVETAMELLTPIVREGDDHRARRALQRLCPRRPFLSPVSD
ncbi:MAG: polysaccharide biosynthesis protein [Polyangiales bacterium]